MNRLVLAAILVFGLVTSIISAAGDPVIIDVRSVNEFNTGHVVGALNMPHDKIGSLIESAVADKNTEVLLYCRSGGRAGVALQTLKSLGYSSARNIGGLNDLKDKYPLTN